MCINWKKKGINSLRLAGSKNSSEDKREVLLERVKVRKKETRNKKLELVMKPSVSWKSL